MNQIDLAVNGTLMRGFDLNANLTSIGAIFIKETRTAPEYRLWSINNHISSHAARCNAWEIHRRGNMVTHRRRIGYHP